MKLVTYVRFESGEMCTDSGWYEFDGYVDPPPDAPPPLSPTRIRLHFGDVFPPLRHPRSACYWAQVGGVARARPALERAR